MNCSSSASAASVVVGALEIKFILNSCKVSSGLLVSIRYGSFVKSQISWRGEVGVKFS